MPPLRDARVQYCCPANKMTSRDSATAHFRRRRQLLLGAAASLFSVAATRARAQGAGKALQVGGLPGTCHLTLPVACPASQAGGVKAAGPLFEFSKYSGWPELKESLMSGRLMAAYMLAPLIMDLA